MPDRERRQTGRTHGEIVGVCRRTAELRLEQQRVARVEDLGQALGVANREVLDAAVTVVHELADVGPSVEGLLERVQRQVAAQKLRDELLDREIFCTLQEAKVLVERWRPSGPLRGPLDRQLNLAAERAGGFRRWSRRVVG